MTELETIVLDWLAQALHLPAGFTSQGQGGGVIQGSASEAAVTALVAARERYLRNACEGLEGAARHERMGQLRNRMVALGSDQNHSATAKGAIIAGVQYRAIPTLLADNMELTGAGLERALEECRRDGLEPFFLTANFGTTNTCAIDRFDEIRDVLRQWPELWVHVDAAYAGTALVLPEYQHLSKQLAFVDSFDVNMHKWMLVNFDASCFFVQKRRDLTDALSISLDIVRNQHSDSGLVTDYRDWQIPFGRRFRALKIWFVFRTYGVSGIQAVIRNHIRMGEMFSDLVRSRPDLFEIVTPPAFALTVFTIAAPNPVDDLPKMTPNGTHHGVNGTKMTEANGKDVAFNGIESSSSVRTTSNKITKEIIDEINASGDFWLTTTTLSGITAVRVVSANIMAEDKYLRMVFDLLVQKTEDKLAQMQP